KIGEAVDLEIKGDQIARGFQPLDTSHVSTAGVQVRQAEQVLLGQRVERYLQGVANRGVEAGIGNGYFLRQGRRPEADQKQGLNTAKDGSSVHTALEAWTRRQFPKLSGTKDPLPESRRELRGVILVQLLIRQ